MGGVCREVLTLQLGHYTNFVGTHWWNIQDAALCYDSDRSDTYSEINNNVLFREGQTLRDQPTYTPRLILVDLKGSLSSLKQEGDLYGVSQVMPALAWNGSLTVHKEDPVIKNQFLQQLNRLGTDAHSENVTSTTAQGAERSVAERTFDLSQGAQRLENSVRVWSDYLGVHLHPKTISLIQQYNHNSTSNRFEAFGFGEKLLRDPMFLDDFEDRLHFYIEECDYLQGFQVLCDLQDGFAGLATKVVELLHDEYGGKAIFTCGFAPTSYLDTGSSATVYRLLNSVMGMVHLSSRSSAFCPMSLDSSFLGRKQVTPVLFPRVVYDASLSYHSSALLATALETLSVPYRLQSNAMSLTQLTNALTVSGRKVVTASAAVPFAVRSTDTLPDVLAEQHAASLWTPLTPCGEVNTQCFAQSVVLRGISREQQVSNLPPGVKGPSILHSCPTGEEVLDTFLQHHFPAAVRAVHLVQTPCKVTTPYPHIFSDSFNRRGQLVGGSLSLRNAVESIPVLSALQSTATTYHGLATLYHEVSRLNLQRFSTFFGAGTELDDFREALEGLRTLAQCYRTNFELEDLDDDSDEE